MIPGVRLRHKQGHSLFNNSKKLKEVVEFETDSDRSTWISQIMMG